MMTSFLKKIASFVSAQSKGRSLSPKEGRVNVCVEEAQEHKIALPALSFLRSIAKKPLELASGRVYPEIYITRRQETLIGVNKKTKEIVKIELAKNPRKTLDIIGEYDLLCKLSDGGAASCPTPLNLGTISLAVLRECVDDEYLIKAKAQQLNYMVQEFVESSRSMAVSDLILALLEQRSLGIYHGDLKPSNIMFDERRGIVVLVDYDQAENIDPSVMQLSALDFLRWCDEAEKRKYGFGSWRRHFPGLDFEADIVPLFRNGAFNLATTTLYRRQITTNTPDGVYHTLAERDVFADGIRDLEGRKDILDTIAFEQGEHVLDLGCNAGLLCHYLYDRGCDVTGVEMDASLVLAAGIIARITGREISFRCVDIDEEPIQEHYDTVMLFSVLHHTSDVEKNARMIASICDRIIVECRLSESGSKPDSAGWRKTSGWAFNDVDSLVEWLESIFIGFVFVKNYGVGDKERYILEFARRAG